MGIWRMTIWRRLEGVDLRRATESWLGISDVIDNWIGTVAWWHGTGGLAVQARYALTVQKVGKLKSRS